MRGRFLAESVGLRALLATSELLLAPLRLRDRVAVQARPARLLLALGGHLGDAVIATAAVRRLVDTIPGVDIGVLLPSWSRVVLEGHPGIRRVHHVDHWHTSRAAGGAWSKAGRYVATRRSALEDIRAIGYEVAVDLYAHFPNSAVLLWRAGIPVRVGYTSAGFSPLYTHAMPWRDDRRHIAQRHLDLLEFAVPRAESSSPPAYDLPPVPDSAKRGVDALLAERNIHAGEYTVVHPGAGSPAKEWAPGRWRAVAERLSDDGEALVFTGQGDTEREVIRSVSQDLPESVDLCDRLEWHEFVEVIRRARRVISVDSVVAHVAAAMGTPCVTLWSSINSADHWRPLGALASVVTHPVSCAPCFRSRGCAHMSCIREIAPSDVVAALERAAPTRVSR